MSRAILTAAFLVATLAFWVAPASAQSAFVQGGVELDARRFSGQQDDRVFDTNAPTIWIGGGGFLAPMISASVELELGPESDVARSVSVTIAGRPETVTTTYTSRRRAVSALFGVHSAAERVVRVGAYAGLAFTALHQRIAADAPAIALSSPPPPTEFTDLAATPVVGVDVAVSLARNVAIVGVVRAQSLNFGGELHGFSVRPGAAVRVSF